MTFATHKNGKGIVSRAKGLRKSGSLVERLLWKALRTSPEQEQIKFRYQHPLSCYVVDFVCLSAKVVVELDGDSHDVSPQADAERQRVIEGLGYKVLRYSNRDVMSNGVEIAGQVRLVAKERLKLLQQQTPPRKSVAFSTLPQGEGDDGQTETGEEK
ncbi:MAG: DUF559 domain-containing protein [Alphaproteobacteria bacterium]|nr:DUF559 domain-containing protein [Alphaproteobacteria bacterium]